MVYREKKAAGCLLRTLFLLVLVALLVGAVLTFWVGSAPEVAVKPGLKGIGRRLQQSPVEAEPNSA